MISLIIVIFGLLVSIVFVVGIITIIMVILDDRKRKHDEGRKTDDEGRR